MRATRMARLSAVLAGVLLASCQPALFLPRYGSMGEGPQAVLTGTLTIEDGCVWIVTPHERYLALWPSHFKIAADATGVTVKGDGFLTSGGEETTVVGGEYPPGALGFVESLIQRAVPEACRHRYWLVTELLPEPLE